ncbi:hypothetical protein BsWGS_14524 [Bradybaena similaris]
MYAMSECGFLTQIRSFPIRCSQTSPHSLLTDKPTLSARLMTNNSLCTQKLEKFHRDCCWIMMEGISASPGHFCASLGLTVLPPGTLVQPVSSPTQDRHTQVPC